MTTAGWGRQRAAAGGQFGSLAQQRATGAGGQFGSLAQQRATGAGGQFGSLAQQRATGAGGQFGSLAQQGVAGAVGPYKARVQGHARALGEQYSTLDQQHTTAEFGMWVVLATEVMLFGGLFTGYTVYRSVYPAGFAEGSRHLDLVLGGLNTAVLIVSSLSMALAVRSAQLGRQRALVGYLLATALLGTSFMAIKALEYSRHFAEGMVPQLAWQYAGPFGNPVQLFFFAYFAMTGLHAVHLSIGIAAVLVTAWLASRGAFPPQRQTPVTVLGLYWHFVDMVWIFLLPLLYLFGLGG